MAYKTLKVEQKDIPIRLDRFLQISLKIPFGLVQKLLRKKKIKLNRKRAGGEVKLTAGDIVDIYASVFETDEPTKPANSKLQAELAKTIHKNIIFRDAGLIVINKPQGVAVHGGTKIDVSVDDILDTLKFEYPEIPKIAHRIDRYTSGILILARTREMAKEIGHLFQQKQVKKKYIAIVSGMLRKKSGVLKSVLAKVSDQDGYEKMDTSEEGKQAITEYRVIKNLSENLSIVEFTPITGRTHQIRIQAAQELGAPIVGDFKYGYRKSTSSTSSLIPDTLCLHALEVEIDNLFGKSYHFKAPLPEYMSLLINR